MFEELFEQEYVFDLLDEWASCPDCLDMIWHTGSKSNFSNRLSLLISKVHDQERQAIKKNSKLVLGFSYQSELLSNLQGLLGYANSPSKLSFKLPEIKILLLQAMVIYLDIKYDNLDLIYSVSKPDAEMGKRRQSQVKDWSKKGSETLKKYNDDDRTGWLKTAEDMREKSPKLALRSIANHIQKNNQKNPSTETVRKYLANNLGKPL